MRWVSLKTPFLVFIPSHNYLFDVSFSAIIHLWISHPVVFHSQKKSRFIHNLHPPKTNSSHLKMGAPWKFGDSYEKPSFLGSVLVFGGVLVSIILKLFFCGPIISKCFWLPRPEMSPSGGWEVLGWGMPGESCFRIHHLPILPQKKTLLHTFHESSWWWKLGILMVYEIIPI